MITERNAKRAKYLLEAFAIPVVEKYLHDYNITIEHIDDLVDECALTHSDVIAWYAGDAIASHDYDEPEAGLHRVFTQNDINILGDLAVEAVAPNTYLSAAHSRERQLIFGK